MDNNPVNLTDVLGLDPDGDYIEEDVSEEEFKENYGKERNTGIYYEGKYDASGKFSGAKFTPVNEWEPKDEDLESENEIGVDANVGDKNKTNEVKTLPKPITPANKTTEQKNVVLNTEQQQTIKPHVKPSTPKNPSNTIQNKTATPWLNYAISQKGVRKDKSKITHNQKIVDYIKSTGLGS